MKRTKIYIYSDANAPIELFTSSLESVDLSGLDLHRAILVGENLNKAKLIRTDFRSANLQYVDFSGCDLGNAIFNVAESEGANFYEANLKDVKANACDFSDADFTKATMDNIILCNAILFGANLLYARNIEKAKLKGAKYDETTIWPEGFNPLKYGAVKAERNHFDKFTKEKLSSTHFRRDIMLDYISVKEAAEKWNISGRRIQKLCEENRIDGVVRFGRSWAIPVNSKKPIDGRTKDGKKEK